VGKSPKDGRRISKDLTLRVKDLIVKREGILKLLKWLRERMEDPFKR
jgi:hypothetical protein